MQKFKENMENKHNWETRNISLFQAKFFQGNKGICTSLEVIIYNMWEGVKHILRLIQQKGENKIA